ncbi:Histidinol dehydrogenase [Planctopirus ephydatiae]|uniref:Histidinol dehydrogenase n=1 Tax=Planctopirus ephydatiae TaxID=2528019 RepID=A0A518GQY1_9PLAN|nr:histidinol dehydrogenase [Planctopirus ephydatiae]QDV31008.1 Histidinol dehydrogenase [Planctopirus ephydatiae]
MTAGPGADWLPVYEYGMESAEQALLTLRNKLSPRGDIVSDAGRARTIELFGAPLSPREVATRILSEIKEQGREALLKYARLLDKPDLQDDDLHVPQTEIEAAHAAVDRQFLSTIRRIRENVSEFQSRILHEDVRLVRQDGLARVELTQRYLPLKRVGICVPGGAAAYPSTILMTAIPAQAAGVQELAVVTPPTKFGAYNTHVLATCAELGITEVYRVGGAQAVAALAYGVEGIPRVDKIVGPGNMFVALAKQLVYGDVDIDSIAGPSEVVVIADDSATASFVASDLLSQAEHSPGSSILITWHRPLIEEVQAEIHRQLADLPRSELASSSLRDFGAIVLVDSLETACQLTDELAPEHLHLSTNSPDQLLERIQNAGAIFCGHYTPVALGDYFAGPSHVLPTGGTARFANGLCSNDFLKRSSVIRFNRDALDDAAQDVRTIATVEGLTAHSQSVDIRLKDD